MIDAIVTLVLGAAALYAVFRIVNSSAETASKVLWVVLVLLFPLLGVAGWYFFGPGGQQGD